MMFNIQLLSTTPPLYMFSLAFLGLQCNQKHHGFMLHFDFYDLALLHLAWL